MSDQPQDEGWWLASDGRWYPPKLASASTAPKPSSVGLTRAVEGDDQWWSRKPKVERRPIIGSRLLWNWFEFRHPWKVFFAGLGGLVSVSMIVSAVLVATSSDSGDDNIVTVIPTEPGAPDSGSDRASEYGSVEIEPFMLPPFDGDPVVGVRAPTVTTHTLDGGRVTLGPSSGVRVVAFFTHWDPFSQQEVTRVTDWLATHDLPPGVDLMVVSTSAAADRDNWPPSEWFTRERWPTVILLDDEAATVAEGFGATAFPYWVVVDANMIVVTQVTGQLSNQQFEEMLQLASEGS